MNKNDSEAFDKLVGYLKGKLSSDNDRQDMQQFILLLHRDILTQHSHHSLSHLVDQLCSGDELKLMLVHVDKQITVAGSAALQCSFVEGLFGLLVFSFGPDYEGNASLTAEDKKHFDTDTPYYKVEKQFFTELCSAELTSFTMEVEGRPAFISNFSLLLC
jgi:hypothetical protein